jgi:putative SOS response-associated peptidase YedK
MVFEWRLNRCEAKDADVHSHARWIPFFAGLWENWRSPDGSQILSCTILTTEPNALMKTIHNRMPVILPRETYDLWLEPGEVESKTLLGLLQPYPEAQMSAFPVSRGVNDPRNDSPECVLPLAVE